MGYNIVYDKQFIKTTTGFIPFVLIGCNNVTEYINGRECRERDWGCLNNASINLSEAELIEYFKGWCGETYQEHFRHHGKWIDNKGLMNFVKNGIKNARTIEEIREFEHGFSLRCQVNVYEKGSYQCKSELYEYIISTHELEAWLEKAKTRLEEEADGKKIYISLNYSGKKPLRLGRKTSLNCEVVALYKNRSYVCEYTEASISFSPDKSKAIVFRNPEHLTSELRRWLKGIRIIKAKTSPKKTNNYVIRADNGYYKDIFVKRKTKGYLHFSSSEDSAKKFSTFKQAEKYISEKLKGFIKCKFSVDIIAAA